jgi:hypothetical protein
MSSVCRGKNDQPKGANPMSAHVRYGNLEAGPEAEGGGPLYSLTLKNQSTQPWTFYVYQQLSNQSPGNFSLAWFASPFLVMVGSQIIFEWNVAYDFVWGSTGGVIIPGSRFRTNQVIGADPNGNNSTTFSMAPGPNLSPPVPAPPPGSLIINEEDNVPNNQYAVGIGMSGAGTYIMQAGPNLRHQFVATPDYWIAAGTDVQVGTVLNPQANNLSANVQFPPNVFSLTMTLDPSNHWV